MSTAKTLANSKNSASTASIKTTMTTSLPSETSPASSLTSDSTPGTMDSQAQLLPPPPPLLMGQNTSSHSLDSLGGHSAASDPYAETKYETSQASPYNNFWTPQISENSPGVTLQVKASVSPPGGSPIASSASSALPHTTAGVNSHPMGHQAYPTYHHTYNPYHAASMDLAYFGGQNYNMANSAAMFRGAEAYDAYQQAASAQASEGRYQLL